MGQLKALIPANTYLPILVLTADIAVETKQRALAGGAKDFLAKPFDLVEVGLRIQNLLESRLLHQQLQSQNHLLEEKVKVRTLELETANKELETANKELKVLNQAKVDFLQLISHEIRTPLNGIIGFLDLLKSEIRAPELLNYLQFLDESVVRLEKFSCQALMITELRTWETRIEKEEVLLDDLFYHSKMLQEEKIQSKKLNVLFLKDADLHAIHGDGKYLRICFDRLLDNAVKFSPPDNTIIVKVYLANMVTVCEFTDHGPGFSTSALEHLFELFWVGEGYVDQRRGLNLALIKLIMDAHNGKIEVINNQPNGTTVRLTF
jgi:two-component system sensor histidine kinase/response regulator